MAIDGLLQRIERSPAEWGFGTFGHSKHSLSGHEPQQMKSDVVEVL